MKGNLEEPPEEDSSGGRKGEGARKK